MVLAVIAVIVSILLPAVQYSRATASRLECLNRLRQIGIALHGFESNSRSFPAGKSDGTTMPGQFRNMSFLAAVLPYLEQPALWELAVAAYEQTPFSLRNPPHVALARAVPAFACPLDGRVERPQSAPSLGGAMVGLTSFLGVSGIDYSDQKGVFFHGAGVRFADISDGTSNTVAVGERPPSPDVNYGWWYSGWGQDGSGNADLFLGMQERVAPPPSRFVGQGCRSPAVYSAGRLDDYCDALHFWSLHDGGANFLLCDGSAKIFSYSSTGILNAMATRSAGD